MKFFNNLLLISVKSYFYGIYKSKNNSFNKIFSELITFELLVHFDFDG